MLALDLTVRCHSLCFMFGLSTLNRVPQGDMLDQIPETHLEIVSLKSKPGGAWVAPILGPPFSPILWGMKE